jgi:hypothetical protein
LEWGGVRKRDESEGKKTEIYSVYVITIPYLPCCENHYIPVGTATYVTAKKKKRKPLRELSVTVLHKLLISDTDQVQFADLYSCFV